MADKQMIIDKLKNDVACKENIINHLSEYNIKLQDQLDQLKAENETYKKMLDDTEVKVALIDVKTGDRELWRNLGMKADKLKQTLTEIKKIMEKHCKKCKKHKFYYFQLCCTCKYTDILQKISEYEVENGR